MRFTYTPHDLKELFPLRRNEILVFSSNTEGKHGKGLAELAFQKAGAKYGQARGMQGQSYAIVTKDLKLGERSIPLIDIQKEINVLYECATRNKDLVFYVGKIGSSLAGYTETEMRSIFHAEEQNRPSNIILPIEYSYP